MDDKTNMDELRAITGRLPPFPDRVKDSLLSSSQSNGIVTEYQMEHGTCLAWNIVRLPEVSVDKWFHSANTAFPRHQHDAHEWIIVTQGALRFIYDNGEEKVVRPDEFVYHTKQRIHRAITIEDTCYITITVPAGKGYPKPKDT